MTVKLDFIKFSNRKREMVIILIMVVVVLVPLWIADGFIKSLTETDDDSFWGKLPLWKLVLFVWIVDIFGWVIWKIAGGYKIYE